MGTDYLQLLCDEIRKDIQGIPKERILEIISEQIRYGSDKSPYVQGYNTALLDLADIILKEVG